MRFPLKAEFDRLNLTLDGRRELQEKMHASNEDDQPDEGDDEPDEDGKGPDDPDTGGGSAAGKGVLDKPVPSGSGGSASTSFGGPKPSNGGGPSSSRGGGVSVPRDTRPCDHLGWVGIEYKRWGQECHRDAANRLLPVDKYGSVIRKTSSTRPPEIPSEVWWRTFSEKDHAKWWEERREEERKAKEAAKEGEAERRKREEDVAEPLRWQ